MLFYKIDVSEISGLPEDLDKNERKEHARNLQLVITDFFDGTGNMCHIAVANIYYPKQKAALCAAVREGILTSKMIESFMSMVDFTNAQYDVHEITMDSYVNMLSVSCQNEYICDDNEIIGKLNITSLCRSYHHGRSVSFSETILSGVYTKRELKAKSESLLCGSTLVPELDRIYQTQPTKPAGHPVHYFIHTDDSTVRGRMLTLLFSALYQNGRIQSRRYCEVRFNVFDNFSERGLKALYESCFGGTIVITASEVNIDDSDHTSVNTNSILALCDTLRKYRNDVLTVFCLPCACEKIKNIFYERLGAVTMVSLGEETVFGERAKAFLRNLAKKQGVKADRFLYRAVADDKKGFSASDIRLIFDSWYDDHMKACMFPQYYDMDTSNKKLTAAKPKGSAYDELEKMIGLTGVKEIIQQVLDFHKAQKLFREKGMTTERPAMHMVFTGNPGTAKTTVARLFAQIMKDNGLLSVGGLHEVGRADLVGKYVGWTADIVKRRFAAAKGSVLFIDEAYSLVDDRDGLYGDEAINTIVQEMENNREDMIVIFAGYSDQMEGFLQKNPGLRSRIAFHVPFADYNADELCRITELLAENKKLTLDCGVRDKLLPIYENAMKADAFGNGRFARNLFEKAVMKQASRLVAMDVDRVTVADVGLLLAEDFEAPPMALKKEAWRIGFYA